MIRPTILKHGNKMNKKTEQEQWREWRVKNDFEADGTEIAGKGSWNKCAGSNGIETGNILL